MFLDDKPLFELCAVGFMQREAAQQASQAVVDEQSRSTDAIKSLERKLGQNQEQLKEQEAEKRRQETWLQSQKIATTAIEKKLQSDVTEKNDLYKVFKILHLFELYSDNPFEQMDWHDRCNALKETLDVSITEYKSEFSKRLVVNEKSQNELRAEIDLLGEIISEDPNERLINYFHSYLRRLNTKLKKLVSAQEKKKKAAEQKVIAEKLKKEEASRLTQEAAEEAVRVRLSKRQTERDKWNRIYLRNEEMDLENYDRLAQVDFIARKIVAVLVAADGAVTSKEQEWVIELWGKGAIDQILTFASSVKCDELCERILEFCKTADLKTLTYLWVITDKAQELIEVDGVDESETEALNKIKGSILSAKRRDKMLKVAERDARDIIHENSNFIYVDYLLRRIAALIIAADGEISSKEQKWIESFWGVGTCSQVLMLAMHDAFTSLRQDIKIYCGQCDEEFCRWLWVVTLQFEELISIDGKIDDAELEALWMIQDAICGLKFYDYSQSRSLKKLPPVLSKA